MNKLVTPTPVLQVQQLAESTLRTLLDSGVESAVWQHVLRHRFGSAHACASALSADAGGAAWQCFDAHGDTLGWGGYFRFHERAGYVGTVQLVLHCAQPSWLPYVYEVLLSTCMAHARLQGAHTLISLLDDSMTDSVRWSRSGQFLSAGQARFTHTGQLHVFYIKLA